MKANGFFLILLIAALILLTTSCSDEDSTLESIEIEPHYWKTNIDSSAKQFSATGNYSDGETKDLTNKANWSSSLPVSSGAVSFNQIGIFTVSASHGGDSTSGSVAGRATIEVVGDLQSISIGFDSYTSAVLQGGAGGVYSAPADSSIPARFLALGRYSDDSTFDITSAATWTYDSSNDKLDSTGDAKGEVYLNKVGRFEIKASVAFTNPSAVISGRIVVIISPATSVVPAHLQSISIGFDDYTATILRVVSGGLYDATSNSSIPARFSATGHYSDASTVDLTNTATWTYDSSDDSLDPIGDGIKGQVYLNKVGMFTIEASADAIKSNRVVVNIAAP